MIDRPAFRFAAIGLAAIAVLTAALRARQAVPPTTPPPSAKATRPVDARLARCQALGAAGAQDPECLTAWHEARERFLGHSERR